MRYGFADKQKQIQRQCQTAGANKAGEYLLKTADEAGHRVDINQICHHQNDEGKNEITHVTFSFPALSFLYL